MTRAHWARGARVLVTCSALAALAGCNDGGRAVSPRRATLESLIDHVFVPMLADVEQMSGTLAQRAGEFCARPDADGLARVRQAWDAARAAWERAELLSFGPQTLPPWRLGGNIDFWPARTDTIEGVLEGDVPLTGSDALRGVGAAGRGFAALEYLLYAPAEAPAALERFEATPRRCEYLTALAADLHARAGELRDVWQDEFVPELLIEQGTERYASVNEAFGEVINSLAFTVEVVRDEKLGRPLGIKSGGEPQPELVPSRFSGRALRDAQDNLRGIASAFSGRYGDDQGRGIADLLRERGANKDAEFGLRVRNAIAALEAIEGPLDSAVSSDRKAVEAAREALRELLVFLQVELTQALSVTVTFGGADGD